VNIINLFSSSKVAGIHRNPYDTAELSQRPQRWGINPHLLL
jgi:hypothetical protein